MVWCIKLPGKTYGIVLILVAVIIAVIYILGLVIAPDVTVFNNLKLSDLLIRYTTLALMLIISGVLGYIGYLIVTSPIPKPVEELVKEYREQTKK